MDWWSCERWASLWICSGKFQFKTFSPCWQPVKIASKVKPLIKSCPNIGGTWCGRTIWGDHGGGGDVWQLPCEASDHDHPFQSPPSQCLQRRTSLHEVSNYILSDSNVTSQPDKNFISISSQCPWRRSSSWSSPDSHLVSCLECGSPDDVNLFNQLGR